jgi:beta-glucosidase
VHDRVKSLKGGLDLEMPGPRDRRVRAVVEAVKSGDLAEEVLDESVRRILGIVFKAQESHQTMTLDVEGHHQLAKKIVGEGIVLLKNDGILPLSGQKKIAVIGRSAQLPNYQGGGSSHINPIKVDIPLDEIKALAGDVEIVFAQGYTAGDEFDQGLLDEAADVAKSADVALVFLALPTSKESEGYDREDLDLTEQQLALIDAVVAVQSKTVIILNSGSVIAVHPWVGKVNALLQAWMMGQAGAGAIAEVLFGVVNPSGKLA